MQDYSNHYLFLDKYSKISVWTSSNLCQKSKGRDTILVVVDRLAKYANFIPLKYLFSAMDINKVFMDTMYKSHGCSSIVSDRDKLFTSQVW